MFTERYFFKKNERQADEWEKVFAILKCSQRLELMK